MGAVDRCRHVPVRLAQTPSAPIKLTSHSAARPKVLLRQWRGPAVQPLNKQVNLFPRSDYTHAVMKRRAVFFDRDNTLIVGNDYLGDPEKVVLMEGAADALARARRLGFATVVVSNQSGV